MHAFCSLKQIFKEGTLQILKANSSSSFSFPKQCAFKVKVSPIPATFSACWVVAILQKHHTWDGHLLPEPGKPPAPCKSPRCCTLQAPSLSLPAPPALSFAPFFQQGAPGPAIRTRHMGNLAPFLAKEHRAYRAKCEQTRMCPCHSG